MFQRREEVIAHGLRQLAQVRELPLRIFAEGSFDADYNTDDVEDNFDGDYEETAEYEGNEWIESDDEDEDESGDEEEEGDGEYRVNSAIAAKLNNVVRLRPMTRQSSLSSPPDQPLEFESLTEKPRRKAKDSPNPKSPLPKKPTSSVNTSTTTPQHKRITRSTTKLKEKEGSLNTAMNKLNIK